MEKIPLTCFVDFVLKSGAPKLLGVREFKEGKDELYADFYRQVRDAIVDMHRAGKPPTVLDAFLAAQRDERRRRIYPSIVKGYRRFLSNGKMTWFEPPSAAYRLGDLDIQVNPELGLIIDGTPHIIQMYFRGELMSAKRVSVVLNLLMNGLTSSASGAVFGVLDVRNAKLHSYRMQSPRLNLLLRGEAASFATIYGAL